jgi:hypothetical protein
MDGKKITKLKTKDTTVAAVPSYRPPPPHYASELEKARGLFSSVTKDLIARDEYIDMRSLHETLSDVILSVSDLSLLPFLLSPPHGLTFLPHFFEYFSQTNITS